jgi:nucleotide-binding universal stress UspA family protein
MKTVELKKVLIALDYDQTAQKVAEMGFSMAKAMNAEIVLLHVVADAAYYSTLDYSPIVGFAGYMDVVPMQLETMEGLKKVSQHFLNKLKHHLGDETIQIQVVEGDFAESILDAAKELHADIIVLGSHSRRWLEEILMGSVTEKVLHHTTKPLFIIPTKKHN